ncbi:MAG TPA: hypothetical protein PKM32_09795, partial [Planctomycetota bacterium]|nr:hypothetical protein [Planctomycetota bacterium]
GGAIYSYGASNSTIVTKNSTIGGNTAHTGGAIASVGNSYSTIILENSTVAANIATNHGGGVFSKARDAKVFLYNSLLYGNYADKSDATSTSTSTNDLYFVKTMPDASGTLNIAYSIFGQSNVNPSSASVEAIQLNYREATLRRNFQFVEEDAQGRYSAQFSSPSLTTKRDPYTNALLYETVKDVENGRTIAIKYTGEVAYSGTLIGKVGNDYYFYNISKINPENGFGTWVSFTNTTPFNFKFWIDEEQNQINPGFGLDFGIVTDTAQNYVQKFEAQEDTLYGDGIVAVRNEGLAPAYRVKLSKDPLGAPHKYVDFCYVVGAHVFPELYEHFSLDVTTLQNDLNVCSDTISLRET